jgi:alpha-ketoglutarate-dependent taurine dioxygenase
MTVSESTAMSTASAGTSISQLGFDDFNPELFRAMLDRSGYVYMDGIPEGFDYVRFFRTFGNLMPQYDGKLACSIKAQDRFEDMYHSLNSRPLMPHTECYEFPGAPPRYLGLWCLIAASDGGGQTTLADASPFLAQLSGSELRQLSSRNYSFVSADSVQNTPLGRRAVHPVYERRKNAASILRFSYNCIEHEEDPFFLGIRERAVKFFDENHVAINIAPAALLLWDNHRVLHARTGFTDRRRHLRRVWLSEWQCVPPKGAGDHAVSVSQQG